jgi:hypothetical protein
MILMFYCLINIAPPAHGSALRCGSRLISEGDTKFKLLAVCGEPQHIDYWEEERTYRSYTKDTHNFNYSTHYQEGQFQKPNFIKELVLVEEWTYNHGPRRFMDHVRLEKGRVKKIVSGESGY